MESTSPQRLLLLLLMVGLTAASSCHYTCASCYANTYFQCQTCATNRGDGGRPLYGMCHCSEGSDEDKLGACQSDDSFNTRSKTLIAVFIALTLALSLFAVWAKGMKYFLYKTIEDVQELSLIVFINMYFPQQMDVFMTHLYRFNISSHTFENLATGSLFEVLPDDSVASTDGQNITGKYRLLVKTANFFSNQFTWIIVAVSLLVFALLVKLLRNCLKTKEDAQIIRTRIDGAPVKT